MKIAYRFGFLIDIWLPQTTTPAQMR